MTAALPAPSGPPHLVIVTGLGGSGKSTAINALEDVGYFCVDNLPILLLDKFLELQRTSAEVHRVAVVMDLREPHFAAEAPRIIQRLMASDPSVELMFLEASDDVLIRRYQATRRPHPLSGPGAPVRDGIAEERRQLGPLREMASVILNTSEQTVHDLKRTIVDRYDPTHTHSQLVLTLLSFGFKHGVPVEADVMFDVRFLNNPYFEPDLRDKRGTDPEVAAFVLEQPEAQAFLNHLSTLLDFLLPLYEREGKRYLTVAIGCTGGHHRSVGLVEALHVRLRGARTQPLHVVHRDIKR